MRQHQPRRSRSHDADLRPHDPTPFCREHEHPNPFVQGDERQNLGHLGGRGTGAKAGNPRLWHSARCGLCWCKSENSFIPGGVHHAPHSAARGPNLPHIGSPADGRRVGADRADRPGQFRRGRRHGRRAGERQEGRLHHHHHRRQRPDGRYSFPAGRLEPGQYALKIRAVGYDLDNGKSGRGGRAEDHDPRSQAAQDRGPRGAAVERRMDQQHPGQRSAQGRGARTASAATRSSASCARRTTPTRS